MDDDDIKPLKYYLYFLMAVACVITALLIYSTTCFLGGACV